MINRSEFCNDCLINKATVFYGFGERCNDCSKIFGDKIYKERLEEDRKEREAQARHVCGEDDLLCSECCEHDEIDHGECLYCGENLMGDMIDRATDYFQDR